MSQENISKIHQLKQDQMVDIESLPPVRRRAWSANSKLKILSEIEELKGHQSDIGAYLRRQGLYASTVSVWRKQRNEGCLNMEGKRGPKPKQTQEQKEIERLEKENIKLKKELDLSKRLIEIQKKVFGLLDEEK